MNKLPRPDTIAWQVEAAYQRGDLDDDRSLQEVAASKAYEASAKMLEDESDRLHDGGNLIDIQIGMHLQFCAEVIRTQALSQSAPEREEKP